jgi:hypothetical protein
VDNGTHCKAGCSVAAGECWSMGQLSIKRVVVVSDPAAIRRVLFENCDILENDSTGVIGCPLTVAGRNWGTPHSKTV